MIDNYLLEELVAFAKYGTLAATAEHLMVTQPTVTRGMQKLEDDLGVALFDRKPNRISLTETGQLAAKEAAKLLRAQDNFIQTVQNFDLYHQSIQIGSTLPGPRLVLKTEVIKNATLLPGLLKTSDIIQQLFSRKATLILSDQELYSDQVESLYLADEYLYVNLDAMTTTTDKSETSFNNLAGQSFLVLSDIGVWQEIIEKHIPRAKFLYQQNDDSFEEINRYANFPVFTTNLTNKLRSEEIDNFDRRIALKITDEVATVPIYANYLIEDKQRLAPLLSTIREKLN
ncbi:LysR family transcriptional regulator [Streptococcus hyovaginalis]|uniref:LysR family transcriptional regulator n=1 Tax=Streptococcus hyovaginalis TaxID=149015 RepID=UPI0014791DD7|nr:LysR family transcriptional regulator [Streptococcus hyovaginalis]